MNDITFIKNSDDLMKLQSSKICIVYLQVKWSCQERISRTIFFEAIGLLKTQSFSVYIIEFDEQIEINNWLLQQQNIITNFIWGGNGEILFLRNNILIDFIKYPFKATVQDIKNRLFEWTHVLKID